MSTTVSALVEVCAPGADDEELAEAARRLRAELLELDVTGAEPAPAPGGAGPDGAKGGGVMAVAGLLVQFAGQDVLAAVISSIQGWLGRQRSRSVATPVLANGRVYAGTMGGHVYAVSVRTGTM